MTPTIPPVVVIGGAVPGRAAGVQSGTCALIQGTAQRETASATFDNVLRVPCSSSFVDAPSGNHCMRFLDGGGTVLGEWCFPVPFAIPEVPGQLSEQGFVVKAPLPEATQRIALMRGDQELVSRTASANPPQVTFTTPQAGDQWNGGGRTLSWNATDPDGDSLTYTVQYSADNRATWLPLKMGFTDTSLTLDPSQIRGGKNVFFRVLASDGFNTATADAGPVEVVQTPSANVSPSSLDFLNLLPGTYAIQRVLVQNGGSGPLTVKSASAGGMFQVQSLLPMRVPAGDSRTINVQFRPTAAGAATGTLAMATDDPAHATIAIPLAGTGTASNTPEIEALPASLDFGYVARDKTADLTVRVRNRGPAALTLTSVAVDAATFHVTPPAHAVTLQAAGTYDVTVTFAPSATGAVSGNLTLSSDDPKRAALKVPLKGAGVATADPLAQVQPASLDFGDVTVGKSKDLTLNLANAGGSALTVKTVAIGNSQFGLTGITAPLTLGPGSHQDVTVRFQPDSAGSQTARLTLGSNDPANPSLDIPLTGNGVPAQTPQIAVSPASLDFGAVTVGQTATLPLAIRNAGTGPLTVQSVSSTRPAYSLRDFAPFTLAAGASQTWSIQFAPPAAGDQAATLTILSNDPAHPSLALPMAGNGQAAATPNATIDATPTALDFASLPVGTTKDLSVTVTSKGPDPLVLSSFTIDNPSFKVTSPAPPFMFTLPGSSSVTVRFSPTVPGPQTCTLIINSNATSQPAFKVALTGAGVAAQALELKVDDCIYETSVGLKAGGANMYFVNRLTPPTYPATLQTVRIYFQNNSGGLPPATQIGVLAGANPTGSANFSNLLLRSTPAQVKAPGQFNDYDVTPITIESGDFVVGFYVYNPPQTYPMALDTSPPYAKRSYYSTDSTTLTVFQGTTEGNFGIRALVTAASGGH